MHDSATILPGSTIGILGGGQLGRMSILAGRRLGYRFHVFEPSVAGSAGAVADHVWNHPYHDRDALRAFSRPCGAITTEFENLPAETLEHVATLAPLRPSAALIETCQNREREKTFLRQHGFPVADFRVVSSSSELEKAVLEVGRPSVLKSAAFGYDGKGQARIEPDTDLVALWTACQMDRAVVEAFVPFRAECSVLVARNPSGQVETFPLAENLHRRHILHQSIVPARFEPKVEQNARRMALALAETFQLEGLLAVELFLLEDGSLLVNELAPRPHNSGHWSFDASLTSQFEQHIRAVAGLPLGATDILRPAVMTNLLGDCWAQTEPDWESLLRNPQVKLHLYDKGEARPGRKMGHFTVTGDSVNEAVDRADRIFRQLT